jgi:sulfur-carrier protein
MNRAESKEISIRYFALFREERGLSVETVNTQASTLADLYQELSRAYKFSLPLQRVRVAVNDEFKEWTESIEDRSAVAFIPPVAGG